MSGCGCRSTTARLVDVLDELDAVRGAGNALLDVALAERDEWQRHAIHLYWFYRMVVQGGPDGGDLDEAIEQDAEAASLYVAAALAAASAEGER